ncbi:MAG: hypothetical protein D3923_17810 [Candidatus Electrothrix sp. AR3]|nr:hypothetical protein [Candidatus Electrothrix sp. AR3]
MQQSEPGSAEQQRSNGLMEEVQRLKVIVQKLLVLSKADAGQLSISPESVNISTMIESMVEDVEIIAPELRIEQDIQAGVMVPADPQLLRQVIQNMASNAVKYNLDQGLIRFCLHKEGQTIRFQLFNSGRPIPKKERKLIFDRFYRIDKSRSNRVPGSGLGLALALEIVRAHKGCLSLDPPVDDLICFTLVLPVS